MDKLLPEGLHHTDTEVYFDGRPSALLLFPACFKALLILVVAIGCALFVDWNKVILNPNSFIEEVKRSGIERSTACLIGFIAGGIAAPVVLLIGIFEWMSTRFRLTNDRVEYERGILSKTIYNVELWRVRDVFYRRTIIQFFLGLGMIEILATDNTIPKLEIGPVPNAKAIYDKLKQARLRAGRIAGAQAMGMSTS